MTATDSMTSRRQKHNHQKLFDQISRNLIAISILFKEKVLFIFEYHENKGVDGIEKYLKEITDSYDDIQVESELKIAFWPKIDVVPEFDNGELRYK